ncbi:hypothetical protein HID58_035816 [Brassica napus]|uniref:BnaA09g38910D protein n=3 Tax=Brassica TaxID=3705 RepID=A0A078IQW6_BRANA|nr:hypothetical protein HID58_035816 [Brassica napus]CAF2048910.1 unnamed protein product [Brassica napus]CAG7866102.1 unnamed protein product [Brassica rapa]CDY52342.1 BnaA09g38910D [Brassica napus]VDC63126.1 unnamed protein product [Brassica rapa]
MAALQGYGLISTNSPLHFPRTHQFDDYKRKNVKWVSPIAAVVPNFHLPMRSLEDKNRTNTEDIRSLRVITAIKTPYLPDGRFDLEAYDNLVNTQIEKGADGRTSQDIPPQVIFKLSRNENLAGVKECVGNNRVEEYTENGVVVWSGNDDQCHDSRWDHGGTGVISVTSNLVPGLMRKLMFEGRNSELNAKLLPLIDWVFQEPNPIGVNTALAQLGVARPVFRLPYVPLPMSTRVEFVKLVKEIGREHFVGERDVQVLDDDDFILIGRY